MTAILGQIAPAIGPSALEAKTIMSKRPKDEEVTLNVTAMLDMAFQLLAFFILTFRPPPGEDQIYLKLPPAQPVVGMGKESAGSEEKNKDPVKPAKSLTITLLDGGTGSLSGVQVGIPSTGIPVKDIPYNDLERELKTYFRAKDENETGGQKDNVQGDYEQVVINASPTLHWDEVMKVADLCTKFRTVSAGKLPEVSFSATGADPGG